MSSYFRSPSATQVLPAPTWKSADLSTTTTSCSSGSSRRSVFAAARPPNPPPRMTVIVAAMGSGSDAFDDDDRRLRALLPDLPERSVFRRLEPRLGQGRTLELQDHDPLGRPLALGDLGRAAANEIAPAVRGDGGRHTAPVLLVAGWIEHFHVRNHVTRHADPPRLGS